MKKPNKLDTGARKKRSFDSVLNRAVDFEVFEKIYTYLSAKPNSSSREIAQYLGDGFDVEKVWDFIKKLENLCGERLVSRTERSKYNSLTPAAERIYKQAVTALRIFQTWPHQERGVVRFSSSIDMINFVWPRVMPDYRKHLEQLEIDADVRIDESPEDINQTVEQLINGKWHCAFVWLHGNVERRIHIAAESLNAKVVVEEPFDTKFEMLVVCPPNHEFVKEARSFADETKNQATSLHANEPWGIDIARLADEIVYVLPAQRQPFYDHLPAPKNEDCERITVDSFSTIIALVQCHVKQGVGLVPSMRAELEEMRRKGQLFYAPIKLDAFTGDRASISIGCITREGLAKLSDPAKKFFTERTKAKILEISSPIRAEPDKTSVHEQERFSIPDKTSEYMDYKYCYFVMQPHQVFGIPRWFKGELDWKSNETFERSNDDSSSGPHTEKHLRGHLEGEFKVNTKQEFKFDVHAWLRVGTDRFDRLFQFVGYGTTEGQRNTIICTFNMKSHLTVNKSSHYSALIGVWSGRNDKGLATIAPMVLSPQPLDISILRLLVKQVSPRCLPNAEYSDDFEKPDNEQESD
jgi:DNA-binding transcriptional LysR family regulator